MLHLRQYNRPPEHDVDETARWISPSDPAWSSRVADERERLAEAAIANLPENASAEDKAKARAEAIAKHPVDVWQSGATRFKPGSLLTVPERLRTGEHPDPVVTIASYLDDAATEFEIRLLGARDYRTLRRDLDDPEKKVHWSIEVVRRGLARVHHGDQTIEPDREPSGLLTDRAIDWLDGHSPALIEELALAIWLFKLRGGDAEGKL